MRYKRNKLIKKLTPTKKAYIAGMIDGEGAISVTKKKDTKGMRFGYCFRPVLHVASTHPQVLGIMQQWTGMGRVGKFDDARENRKARYQWMCWSNQAAQVVSSVFDFLIIKRRRAKTFLKFITVTRSSKSPGASGLSNSQWRTQHSLYEKMKQLNMKGI